MPDLEPLLIEGEGLSQSLVPRSRSSPQCSPHGPSISTFAPASVTQVYHSSRAGVVLVSDPNPPVAAGGAAIGFENLWGTVCSMCSATLGAGALSLPYAFQSLGVCGGLLLLLLTAGASHYSVVLLTSSIEKTGTRSYEELTVRLFGKWMGVLVELNIIIFCFGSAVAYTIALGDLLHPLTGDYLWNEIDRPLERFRPIRANRFNPNNFKFP